MELLNNYPTTWYACGYHNAVLVGIQDTAVLSNCERSAASTKSVQRICPLIIEPLGATESLLKLSSVDSIS